MKNTLREIEEVYDLELDRIEQEVKKKKAKKVLLQFPDGMKPYATAIVRELERRCKGTVFAIWLSSCFGACDIPQTGNIKFDLLVQFGHSPWIQQ